MASEELSAVMSSGAMSSVANSVAYAEGVKHGWRLCEALALDLDEQIRRDLDKLTEAQARIVLTVCRGNMRYDDVGRLYGITSDTVRKTMQNAAKALGLSGTTDLRRRFAGPIDGGH